MKFEWDAKKAEANWRKHNISFEQAREVFRDQLALDELDEQEDYGEDRYNIVGVAKGRLLFVTYTARIDEEGSDEIVRIISARLAERHERKRYHEGQAGCGACISETEGCARAANGKVRLERSRCDER